MAVPKYHFLMLNSTQMVVSIRCDFLLEVSSFDL